MDLTSRSHCNRNTGHQGIEEEVHLHLKKKGVEAAGEEDQFQTKLG